MTLKTMLVTSYCLWRRKKKLHNNSYAVIVVKIYIEVHLKKAEHKGIFNEPKNGG